MPQFSKDSRKSSKKNFNFNESLNLEYPGDKKHNRTVVYSKYTEKDSKEGLFSHQASDIVSSEITKLKEFSDEMYKNLNESAMFLREQLHKDQEELSIHVKIIHEENKQLLKQRLNDLNRIENNFKRLMSELEAHSKDLK